MKQAHASCLSLDLQFDDDRAIGGNVLVFCKCKTAAATGWWLCPGLPAEFLGGQCDDVARTGIF
jgi:hypothetical protein